MNGSRPNPGSSFASGQLQFASPPSQNAFHSQAAASKNDPACASVTTDQGALPVSINLTPRQKVKLVFDLIRKTATAEEVAVQLGVPLAEVEQWLAEFLQQSSKVLKISPTPEIRSLGRRIGVRAVSEKDL